MREAVSNSMRHVDLSHPVSMVVKTIEINLKAAYKIINNKPEERLAIAMRYCRQFQKVCWNISNSNDKCKWRNSEIPIEKNS